MSAAYESIQEGLRDEFVRAVGRNRYRLWFRDAAVCRLDEDTLTLAVPTEVHRTWLEYTYGTLLKQAAEHVLGEGIGVHLEVSEVQGAKRELRERLPADAHEWEAALARLRPRPTFASFVAGPTERFPLLLLSQLLHGHGQRNPPAVYLYGERGVGKSHLLRALFDAGEARAPGEVAYLTSRRFTSRFVSAVRNRRLDAVRALEEDLTRRRLLLVDDLHGLAGRTETQRALVRLREKAQGTETRFVFACRRHPRELEGFSPKLQSWLMGSVILRLPSPDRAARRRILEARAKGYGLDLPQDVADWVFEHTASMRGAVQVLDRWAVASQRMGRAVEADWLPEIAPSVTASAREEVIRRAKQVVADHFGIDRDLLDRPTKARSAALPRRVAMYLVYRAAAVALVDLGLAFGLRSHSSVSRAIQQVRLLRERDPGAEQLVDGLLERM